MAVPLFFYFWWAFGFFVVLLHCTVTPFIVLQRFRKNSTYASPFFLLYIFTSISDLNNIIISNFLSRFIAFESFQPWLKSHIIYFTIVFLFSSYGVYSQAIFHTAISINRVWVSFFLLKKGNSALEKFGNCIIWFLPIFGIIILSPHFAGTLVYIDVETDVLIANYNETWLQNYISVAGLTLVLSTSCISLILTFTILRYRHLLKQTTENGTAIKREMYLLIQATVTFLFELLVTCFYIALFISITYDLPNVVAYASLTVDYIVDIQSLVNPCALLIVCKYVRMDYKEFWLKFFSRTSDKVVIISSQGNH